MAIQRPVKTYGTRSYVAEVAAAPNNTDPILASEVDADLDTMYTAFNALVVNATIAATAPAAPVQGQLWWRNDPDGNLYISYNDGNSTQWVPAVPSSAPQWAVSGSSLTPVDATKMVTVLGASGGDAFRWGTRTVKHRLTGASTADALWIGINHDSAGAAPADDPTKPRWNFGVDLAADKFNVLRSPAGVTAAWAIPLALGANGDLTLAATISCTNYCRVAGSTGGVRFQNVGSMSGDGYSNQIAFGWSPSLMARVDGSQLGSVNLTAPSDERLKLNLQENVPGLAAVCALRPITFEYDQTKREIGFEPGRHYGLIAQEAQVHVPLVIEDDGSEEHFLGLDYRKLVPVLIQALKELATRVAALEAR
jgi:hypothetical protein